MAISHVQPLLLLLISLFFFVALGDIDVRRCSPRQYPVKVSDVKISPYPIKRSRNATITITGDTSEDIPDGVTVALGLSLMGMPVSTKNYSLCDITTCPVAPGPLVLTLPNILTEREKRSRAYMVAISITEEGQEPLMCVVFVVKIIKGYASLLSQVTG